MPLLTMCLVACVASPAAQPPRPLPPLEVQRLESLDLFCHAMAHLDLAGDATTLYAPAYVQVITRAKQQMGIAPETLERDLAAFAPGYAADAGLRLLHFMPFLIPDAEDFTRALIWLSHPEGPRPEGIPSLTFWQQALAPLNPQRARLLAQLATLLRREQEDFHRAWARNQQAAEADRIAALEQAFRTSALPILAPLLGRMPITLVVTPGLTAYGRGLGLQDGRHRVAVGLPQTDRERSDAVFQAIHELTHAFTDPLTGQDPRSRSTRAGSDGARIHQILENAAFHFDHLLIRKVDPKRHRSYLRFALERMGAGDVSEAQLETRFLATFPVDAKLARRLRAHLPR